MGIRRLTHSLSRVAHVRSLQRGWEPDRSCWKKAYVLYGVFITRYPTFTVPAFLNLQLVLKRIIFAPHFLKSHMHVSNFSCTINFLNFSNYFSQVVRMFIIVVTIFGICWLPYHLFFVYAYHNNQMTSSSYVQQLYLGFYWLAMSNAMVNPIIYYWMNSRLVKLSSIEGLITNSQPYFVRQVSNLLPGHYLLLLLAVPQRADEGRHATGCSVAQEFQLRTGPVPIL